MSKKVAVLGGGGFIGSHLTTSLVQQGHNVLSVDKKKLNNWEQINPEAESICADLTSYFHCMEVTRGMDEVYLLAADMGGMGFIETHKVDCMLSTLININVLKAAALNNVQRLFYSSSACVYPSFKQHETNVIALKESDAWPADPEEGYGLEKLYGEKLCENFDAEGSVQTRVGRFHNVYGTHTAYRGGREKAPAAICRKVIEAKLSGNHTIEIWGDGHQTRSFMYVSDCVKGINLLMQSDYNRPVNIGSAELVSINQLVTAVEAIAGVKLERNYNLTAPQGVRGRNSDNTLIQSLFDWEPSTPLVDGLELTYRWVFDELNK